MSRKIQSGVVTEGEGFYAFVTIDGLTVEGANFDNRLDAVTQSQEWFKQYSETEQKPTPEVTVWLSEVLEQIEKAGDWDDGAALRAVIIGEYGLVGLQQIEAYGRRIPVVDTWPGDMWIKAGPWSTAREYRRRKDEIRALYRG